MTRLTTGMNMPAAGPAPEAGEDSMMRKGFIIRGGRPMAGNSGAVLVLALLTLAMVTVLGVYSTTRTAMEQQISNNMEQQVEAFFAAEGGLSHGRRLLQNAFVQFNQQNLAAGKKVMDWDFILNGAYNGNVATTYWCGGVPIFTGKDCAHGSSALTGDWTQKGVLILDRSIVIGLKTVQYQVWVWDNVDHMFSPTLAADSSWKGDGSVEIGCKTLPTSACDCQQPQVSYELDGTIGWNASASSCYQNYDPLDDTDGSIFVRSVGIVTVSGQVTSTATHEITFQGLISGKGQIVPGLAQEFANEGHSSSGMDMNDMTAANLGSGTTM